MAKPTEQVTNVAEGAPDMVSMIATYKPIIELLGPEAAENVLRSLVDVFLRDSQYSSVEKAKSVAGEHLLRLLPDSVSNSVLMGFQVLEVGLASKLIKEEELIAFRDGELSLALFNK